jgi:hypothetical protein
MDDDEDTEDFEDDEEGEESHIRTVIAKMGKLMKDENMNSDQAASALQTLLVSLIAAEHQGNKERITNVLNEMHMATMENMDGVIKLSKQMYGWGSDEWKRAYN